MCYEVLTHNKMKMYKKVLAIVVTFSMLLTAWGCKGADKEVEEQPETRPIVNLKAISLGNIPTYGMEEFYQELDALTIPELNCTLRFEYIPWGDERKQINIATASGEYDFIPGGVFSDYRILVTKNAFLDLNTYLHLVPELQEHYESYQENALKYCEINGGLYGFPQLSQGGIKGIDEGFFYREDLRKKWGLEEITDLHTMEAYLYRAKEEERYKEEALITDNRIWNSLWTMITKGKYLEINSVLETPFVVVEAKNPSVLIKRMETPEFLEVLFYIKKWREDGILDSDMLALSNNEGMRGKNLMLADKKPCETNSPIWAVNSSYIPDMWDRNPDWEFGFFPYAFNNIEYYSGSLSEASVISVSSKTKEPETAIKLLEKVHTDQRYHDLLQYGVEGIHYRLKDGKLDYDGIPIAHRFSTWTASGDYLLEYEAFPVNQTWYDEVLTPYDKWSLGISEEAKEASISRFTFLTNGLERELDSMEEIRLKYYQPILCGYAENYEEELRKANEIILANGFEKYFDNMQEQILNMEEE